MEPVRCFIAVELPEDIKKGLKSLQARLKSGGQFPAKWVDPYSIHLTLKFLGNVAPDRLDEITAAMEEACRGVSPFNLEVKGLGVFPNPRRVQVAWVGVGGEVEKLAHLQQRLESALAGLGFAPENRRFAPHLTLARLRDRASTDERQRFGQLIADSEFEAGYSWPVSAVNLMRSQLTKEGAIYSRISSVAL
ncbi:MAG TPA: RNA 2',3'-cyclic phosphodiesterase [Dehalococcoidia bacterium]|nr:RNA 2',3'-cyclic phosphodiesterase [Dehalococcoidia bacterium]